jgi:hypothetical protein
MTRRGFAITLLAGASLIAGVAVAASWAQGAPQRSRLSGANELQPEPLTPFERELVRRAEESGDVHMDENHGPADNNARGLRLKDSRAAIVGLVVRGRKYGISLDGTRDVLIKNFSFIGRRSNDRFGSGLILGQQQGTRGETWLSNAWIDLKEPGPEPDYQKANNEAISVERNNAPLNIRRAVLIGGAESGIDNKGDVRMDASFVASGHRPIRVWNGGSLIMANSTVLAMPRFGGFWFGGGEGPARLEYYNCRFGRVGNDPSELLDEIPDWMVAKDEDDPVEIRIRRLGRDPFDRDPGGFWVPAKAPNPRGYLSGRE